MIAATQERIGRISAGVGDVLKSAPGMGIRGPDAKGASPIVDVLKLYASAAAVSHLANECEALLLQAAQQQALVGARALRATMNDMTNVVDQSSDMLAPADRAKSASLARDGNDLQVALARGEQVDAAKLDETSLAAEEIAFRGRINSLYYQTGHLQSEAHKAGEGLASHIARTFHGSFKKLQQAIGPIRATLGDIELMRQEHARETNEPRVPHDGAEAATMRELRRSALNDAKKALEALRANSDLVYFLREGASIIQWQNFATACVKTLALIGVSFVSAGIGTAVGEAAEGAFAAGMGAESIAELSTGARFVAGGIRYITGAATESAGNAAAQIGIMGGDPSMSGAFLENLIQKVGSDVVLNAMAKDLGLARQVEKREGGLWVKRAGKFVLKETAVITAHTLWGAAMGNVAHMLVERTARAATPMELREWVMQGAATALGRYAHQIGTEKKPLMDRLGHLGLPNGDRPALVGKQLLMLAERAQQAPSSDDAMAIVKTKAELDTELDRVLGELERRPDIAKHNTDIDVARERAKLDDERIATGPVAQIALSQANLREVSGSGIYEGAPAEVDQAIANAKRMGLAAKRLGKGPAGHELVQLGDRTIEVHEIAAGAPKPPVAPHEEEIRWDNEVSEGLTAEERERWLKIKGKRKIEDVMRDYASPKEAIAAAKKQYARDQERAAKAAASDERKKEMIEMAQDRGILKSPEARKILDDMAKSTSARPAEDAMEAFRSLVVSEYGASLALREHGGAGHGVRKDVVVWQETNSRTMEEFLRSPEAAKSRRGKKVFPTDRGDRVYVEVTDMDIVVVADRVSGRERVLHREEIKTGKGDSPTEARGQLDNARDAMAAALAGGKPVILMDGGVNITDKIDFASAVSSTSATRGPAGKKGFDKDLGISVEDLDVMARELMKIAQAEQAAYDAKSHGSAP